MLRQVVQRLSPVANAVTVQLQRNIAVSATLAQQQQQQKQESLDPIQQLFVNKIREYRTKSADGKLVDATPEVESSLKDQLANLARAYGAKGQDMTQFPTFNFSDPQLVWPGLSEEQILKMEEAVEAHQAAEQLRLAEKVEEEEPFWKKDTTDVVFFVD